MSDIIASVSGIRGIVGDSLTPGSIVNFTSAFASLCRKKIKGKGSKIVVGRDGRTGGDVIESIVISTLSMCGFDVVNIGIAPTPTVQIATEALKCAGGISITASHNSQIWNGLKFLNPDGTFLDENDVRQLLEIAESKEFEYAKVNQIKIPVNDNTWISKHIEKLLGQKIFNVSAIREKKFRIVVDAVNSSGSLIVPMLLERLGCKVVRLFCDRSGIFPHTPEPLPENLLLLSRAVKKTKADIGIAVDPDADRLVLITDKGKPFSEENTIVSCVNFMLRKTSARNKNVTVNLSTTRAVDDVARKYNAKVFRSAVGEINVVNEMKRNNSIIGGEGSGGVIYPELHFGRDSLVGIAIILNELADFNGTLGDYKKTVPQYFISKTKIDIVNNPDNILKRIEKQYNGARGVIKVWKNDGLKIDSVNGWVHLRKSNTEPIIRIITEAPSKIEAVQLQKTFLSEIKKFS